jgi:hypothetical protein
MTQHLPEHQCFMRDFAYLDQRSVHAHLRGRSMRAHVYTRVTINDLRAMHARFHPRETGSEFPDDPLP